MIDAALDYAKQGLLIFPCAKKIPLSGPGGFKNASGDAAQIRSWWGQYPAAQIGLPTGQINGLFVVDIDGPEGVEIVKGLHLPETLTVETRPGRWQLWFRVPDGLRTGCTAGVIGPQIDTRGDGGYVIAPPSIHHESGKPYRVVKKLPWADVPAELLAPKNGLNGKPSVAASPDLIPQGQRHQTMLSIAGALRARGLSPSSVLVTLQTINLLRCHPPLEPAELEKLASYVGGKTAGFPGARQVGVIDSFHSSHIGMKFETNQSAAQKLPFRTAKQIADETPDKVEWIAKPYVVLGGITEVDGKVKLAGKSTWTTHLCGAVLDGLPFMGEPTMRTPIVYLTEQPPSSWRLTLERAGLLGREDFHCLYFKDIRGIMWSVVVDEAVAHCRNVGAKLLVVDTLGQFAGITGDNENNTGDALVAMGPLQEAAGNGIAVIILRHDRKSGGLVGESGRGSSAYSGAVDIVLSIRRPEGHTKKTLRTIHAIGRFDDTPEELVIDLTPTGYVPLGTFANVAEAEAEKVLLSAAPRTEEEAASVEELIKGTEVARATAHRVVKSLCNRDKLFGVGKGKKGDPFRYFLTKKDSSQTSNTGETNETNPSGEQNVIPFDAPETALDPEREQGTPKVIPPETRAPSGKGVSFETFEAILGPFVKPKPSRGQNAQPPKKPVSKSEVEQSGREEEL